MFQNYTFDRCCHDNHLKV